MDFDYVACPKCQKKFMAGKEFFRIPDAYCHCPYCATEFRVGVAAQAQQGKAETPGQSRPGQRQT